MGLEKMCEVRHGRQTTTAKVHLDTSEIQVRGDLKLRIPLADVKAFESTKGELGITWSGGTTVLALGPDADAWALKIRYPRGRLDKLGVKPGLRVAVIGLDDPDFLNELRARTDDVSVDKATKDTDIVVVHMTKTSDLPRLKALGASIKKDGMIWVVWPKGRKEFREDHVRACGPTAGLVDVKVMSFSDTLSGLKMVIPKKDR